MKKAIAILMMLVMALSFTACGGNTAEEEPVDDSIPVAMISGSKDVNDGSFNQAIWESIENMCAERGINCSYYIPEKQKKKAYKASVKEAVDAGAKIVFMAGSTFETAAYDLQKKYEDVYFVVVDGVPHDKDKDYKVSENSLGVLFAEEEAGFMAGYATVIEGYKNIGFMGGKDAPAVKRYGAGFVQGINAAVKDKGLKGKDFAIKYSYMGTYDESKAVRKEADKWFKDGTEVIFACGGAMGKSVMKAAEDNNGKVIGVDVDQSNMSDTVITSAEKNIALSVEDILKDFDGSRLTGGTVYTYSTKNEGVGLSIDPEKMTVFTQEMYDELYKQIAEGSYKIKKDAKVKSVKKLVKGGIDIDII